MIHDPALRRRRLSAIARPSGALALVALDQRESLRSMLASSGHPASDDDLGAFKVSAAQVLSPAASGLLLDARLGLGPVADAAALDPGCGLMVAADRIEQPPGGPIRSTVIDDALDLEVIVTDGAEALKLLVLWRPDDPEPAERLTAAFVERCARLGVLSLVEGVVRTGGEAGPATEPSAEEHAALVVRAAASLAATGPDLYKAEVPTLGREAPAVIEDASRWLTDAVSCPWVVLSNGTPPDAFPRGVAAACRGGASGFLAGRAVWAPALAAPDVATALATDALPRLERLVAIVDAEARAWHDAMPEGAS